MNDPIVSYRMAPARTADAGKTLGRIDGKAPISEIIAAISTGTFKGVDFADLIGEIRQSDARRAKELKYYLPSITASCTCDGSAKTVLDHSGLMQIDFDELPAGLSSFDQVRQQLITDPFTYVCCTSPSGKVKALVKIEADRNSHLSAFFSLEQYYRQKYNLVIDRACKNVNRLMFLTYDQNVFINDAAAVYVNPAVSDPLPSSFEAWPGATAVQRGNDTDKAAQVEYCLEQIETNHIDITAMYNDWLKVGFALADEFGEHGRQYFHRVSANNAGYDQGNTDTQFTNCLKGTGKAKVKIASFFQACKDYGIDIKNAAKNGQKNAEKAAKKSERTPKIQQGSDFYEKGVEKKFTPETIRALELIKPLCYATGHDKQTGKVSKIEISFSHFNELLYSYGFRRYDIDKSSFVIVRVENNVLDRVAPVQVQDTFFQLIAKLPETLHDEIPTYLLKEHFTKNREKYFSLGNLSLLKNDAAYDFCSDTKDEAFIFYSNGYVRCSKGNVELVAYSQLKQCIWRDQILNRSFEFAPFDAAAPGIFSQFVNNVCANKPDRFNSLCSLIGYMLHSYYHTKRKAIILTDSEINENPSGRTGKGLLLRALQHMKPMVIINGKDFKTDEKFKYQDVGLETQIVAIDDVRSGISIESFFNDIVEGLKVEKKNQAPYKRDVKMAITTNKTIKIEGASARDRVIEFEVSEHYSEKFSPQDEFKKWFFTEFTDADWQQYDNFMCYCIGLYLDKGIVMPDQINLHLRKLLDQTGGDFVTWMNDLVDNGQIMPGNAYDKKELHRQFLEAYPDYKERMKLSKQRAFTDALKTYIEYSGRFAAFNKKEDERRSNGKDLIIFRRKDSLVEEVPF